MKTADPGIRIGAAVSDRSGPDAAKWDSPLLQAAGKNIDFITPHFYSTFNLGWAFYGNETKWVEFKADSDGTYMLELIAEGTPADGGWPIIVIKADKSVVGELIVDSTVWRTYKIPVNLNAGMNRISISYINDLVSKTGEDRNCFIYDMVVTKGGNGIYQLFNDDNISNAVFGTINEHEARLRNLKNILMAAPKKDIKIAITEYNVIYNNRGSLPDGYRSRFDEISNLRSALFVGDLLSLFIREGVWMANFWLLMGEMGNLQVSGDKISYRPSYYALKMFREHAGQRLCSNSAQVSKMDSVPLGNYPAYKDIPILGVTSTVDRSGKITVSVINRSRSTDINSTIRIKGGSDGYLRKATVLAGESMEADGKYRGAITYHSTDTVAGPNEFKYLFPKHSIVQIELVPHSTK
jgi:alpha-L-arabinofuranosidase